MAASERWGWSQEPRDPVLCSISGSDSGFDHLIKSGSTIDPKDTSTGSVLKKQSEWERQMASADQRQTELFHSKWNLVRDQIGTFARELSVARTELDALRTCVDREVSTQLKDLRAGLDNELRQRGVMFERLDQQIGDQRDSLAQERRARETLDGKVGGLLDVLQQRVREDIARALGDIADMPARERAARESQMGAFHASVEELDARLRADIARAESELQGGHARMREEMAQLAAEHQASHDGFKDAHQLALEELDAKLRDELNGKHGALDAAHRAAIEALDAQVKDEISRVAAEHQDSHGSLRDSHRSGLEELDAKLKEELAGKHGQLDAAHRAALEDIEVALRAEMGQGHGAHTSALEDLEAKLREELEGRHGQLDAAHRAALESLDASLKELAGRHGQLDAGHRAALESLDASLKAEVSRVAGESQERHITLSSAHDVSLESLEARLRQELESKHGRLSASQQATVEALDGQLRAQILQLQAEHRADHSALREGHRVGLAGLQDVLEQERGDRNSRQLLITERLERAELRLEGEVAQASAVDAALKNCDRAEAGYEALRCALEQESKERTSLHGQNEERLMVLEAALSRMDESLLDRVTARYSSSVVGRGDFEFETRRLWEAVDTHTHNLSTVQPAPVAHQVHSTVVKPPAVTVMSCTPTASGHRAPLTPPAPALCQEMFGATSSGRLTPVLGQTRASVPAISTGGNLRQAGSPSPLCRKLVQTNSSATLMPPSWTNSSATLMPPSSPLLVQVPSIDQLHTPEGSVTIGAASGLSRMTISSASPARVTR